MQWRANVFKAARLSGRVARKGSKIGDAGFSHPIQFLYNNEARLNAGADHRHMILVSRYAA